MSRPISWTLLCAVRAALAVALVGVPVSACVREAPGGVVAAATPEAADAGVEILDAGGNAVDAAVAVALALAVTEPAMSGLGGQTQILLAAPGTDPVAINGTSFAPRATPAVTGADEIVGRRATTIPTAVNTLAYAWRRYGSGNLTWADLVAPAVRLAEEGFVVGPFRHLVWQRHVDDLRGDSVTAALFLAGDGAVPAPGTRFAQPVLAATLRRLASAGAGDFYSGDIARTIAADMRAHGGWITFEDLSSLPDPVELAPLHGTYRGWDVYTLPPPGGGWQVIQILNLLEQSPAEQLSLGSPERLLRLAEALRLGHRERRDGPVRDLVGYHDEVAEKLSKETARRLLAGSRGETTHVTVADAQGFVVSVTASINAFFGARAAAPGLGFLYNDYMREFELADSTHPYALRPGAMPYSSMSPTIVARDGRPALGLGSPGSARIISAVVQVTQLWVDAGVGVRDAVAAPRLHVVPDSVLYLESPDVTPAERRAAHDLGLTVAAPPTDMALGDRNAYFGGVHAVAWDGRRWRGAADPRRDGAVRLARRPRRAGRTMP